MDLSPSQHHLRLSAENCNNENVIEGRLVNFPSDISIPHYFQKMLMGKNITPEKIGLIYKCHEHTFQEVDEISNKLAISISQFLLNPKERNRNPDGDVVIGICLRPTDLLVLILLGIMKAGAAYVPFDTEFPAEKINQLIKSVCPILIISESEDGIISKFNSVKANTTIISATHLFSISMEIEDANFVVQEANATDVAVILYTSGSSGTPKGVRISHRAILNRLSWQWEAFPYQPNERCCLKSSLNFAASVYEIFGGILSGTCLSVIDGETMFKPNLLIKELTASRISRIFCTPSLLQAILRIMTLDDGVIKIKNSSIPDLKLWICLGEPLSIEKAETFFHVFPTEKTMVNFFGCTECGGFVYETYRSLEELKEKTFGSTLSLSPIDFNTSIYILNDEMIPCEDGTTGEICIASYNLAQGYVGIKNSERFVLNSIANNPAFARIFRTGDYGHIDRCKYNGKRVLVFHGRIDSQVKVRGLRVDLLEIEQAIASLTSLVQSIVVLCYHPGLEDQALVAFVIPTEDSGNEVANKISVNMLKILKPYEIPTVKLMQQFPLLPNQKTDRQALLKTYEEDLQRSKQFDKENMEKANILVRAISEVTGTSAFCILTNLGSSFSNLGGTSLNSVLVILKLREYNFNISIMDFVMAPNLIETIKKIQPLTFPIEYEKITISEAHENYSIQKMDVDHKEVVLNILVDSFYRKGDLENWLNIPYDDHFALYEYIFDDIIKGGLSHLVQRKSDNKIVASNLACDFFEKPQGFFPSESCRTLIKFLQHCESQIENLLPVPIDKGSVIYGVAMGTHSSVNGAENTLLISLMKSFLVKTAKENGFIGAVGLDTSPLSIQLNQSLGGYETLCKIQINEYVDEEGQRPFFQAPDSQVLICSFKRI